MSRRPFSDGGAVGAQQASAAKRAHRNPARAQATTRERILRAASELFALKGYSGTSTREIAAQVKIRQPSLFHHFPSKSAIAEALLEHSVSRVAGPVLELANSDEPAPDRLYGYVHFDTRFLAMSPYDLSGLYSDDVVRAPGFEHWRNQLNQLHASIAEMVRQGIAAEQLRPLDPVFAQRVLSGLNLVTISMYHDVGESRASSLADEVATFILRGLLVALSDLPRVRHHGLQIAAQLSRQVEGAAPRTEQASSL